jgi:hypothetical protein
MYSFNCDQLFDAEEANFYIKSFGEFSDASLDKIRTLTNNVPLYISFLKESNDESQIVQSYRRVMRTEIDSYKNKLNDKLINENEFSTLKIIIENIYIKILDEKIKTELALKIENFMKIHYKFFSLNDRVEFASIVSQLNNPLLNLETGRVIKLLDFELMSIHIDKNKYDICNVKTIYPQLMDLYNEILDKTIDETVCEERIVSVSLIDTINKYIDGNKFAGYYFESFIHSFFFCYIYFKDSNIPDNLKFINEVNVSTLFDLFEYIEINDDNTEEKIDMDKKILSDILEGFHFKTRKPTLKYIDGGFFIHSDNLTCDLYTYDTAIQDKSSEFKSGSKFESLRNDVNTALKNIENLFEKYWKLPMKLQFKKHYFILGIDFENENDRIFFLTNRANRPNLKLNNITHNEGNASVQSDTSAFKYNQDKVDKMKELIKIHDCNHFGIIEAKVEVTKSTNNENQYYSLILNEVEL